MDADARIRSRHRKALRAVFSQAIARLQQNAAAAAQTILKIMVDPNMPASSRLRAADMALEYSLKGIELEDLLVRVSELEREVGLEKSSERIYDDDEIDRPKNKVA